MTPLRIMTVCTGNICRSPMAMVVLRDRLERAGIEGVAVASTGVSDEEQGNPMDRRAVRALDERGYRVPAHTARRITSSDIAESDLLLAMTYRHYEILLRRARPEDAQKIRMYREFDPAMAGLEPGYELDLEDPWYGGPREFEEALDQIEDAADGVVFWARASQRSPEPSPALPYSATIFDLDGTLFDSAAGITGSLVYALKHHGYPAPAPEVQLQHIGPPMYQGLQIFDGLDEDEARAVERTYLEHYRDHGWSLSVPYPGVKELLRALHAAGARIGVATSKPKTLAGRSFAKYGLTPLADSFAGASPDETYGAKPDVLRDALDQLRRHGGRRPWPTGRDGSGDSDPGRGVMIGDRSHDIEAGNAAGLDSIGVLWGYGSREELSDATMTVGTMEELAQVLGVATQFQDLMQGSK